MLHTYFPVYLVHELTLPPWRRPFPCPNSLHNFCHVNHFIEESQSSVSQRPSEQPKIKAHPGVYYQDIAVSDLRTGDIQLYSCSRSCMHASITLREHVDEGILEQ